MGDWRVAACAVAGTAGHARARRSLPCRPVCGLVINFRVVYSAAGLRRAGDCFDQFRGAGAGPVRRLAFRSGRRRTVAGRDHKLRRVRPIHFDRTV